MLIQVSKKVSYSVQLGGMVVDLDETDFQTLMVEMERADSQGRCRASAADVYMENTSYKHPNTSDGWILSSAVMDLINAKDKIRAIGQLRKETTLGLKEAKDIVEHRADELGISWE